MALITDISNSVFYDDLYISSFNSDSPAILSRKSAEKNFINTSLSDAFDAEAQEDIQNYLVSFTARPLLAASHSSPALVFNFLYHSTLTVVTSFPDVDLDTALCYAKESDAFIIAESLEDRAAHCDKNADRSKFFILDGIIKSTYEPLLNAATYTPLLSKDILGDMLTEAQHLSVICGCAAEMTQEGSLTRSPEEQNAAELDFPLYTAALITLFLLARRFCADRRARVRISKKDESPFVTLSFEPIPLGKGLKTDSDRFTKELFDISSAFKRLDALFYTAYDGKNFSISFSPVRTEWSLLGIKDEDGKLIYDAYPPRNDG